MALESIKTEILEKIHKELGVGNFNRPHAVLIDSGDYGTVFSFLPLFPQEFKKLPPELQRYVYCISQGRYGLIAFLPKNFEPADDGNITSVTEIYDDYGTLREIFYTLDITGKEFRVENSLRREKLQVFAKKKKIPVKKIIRSRA